MDEKNCPNCGAPKRGAVCEYCGTRFDTESAEKIVIRDWSGEVVHVIERNA